MLFRSLSFSIAIDVIAAIVVAVLCTADVDAALSLCQALINDLMHIH